MTGTNVFATEEGTAEFLAEVGGAVFRFAAMLSMGGWTVGGIEPYLPPYAGLPVDALLDLFRAEWGDKQAQARVAAVGREWQPVIVEQFAELVSA